MAEGMSLKATHNLDEVFAKLDAYGDAIRERATVLALNRLGDRASVAGNRAIRKRYGLTIEQLKRYIDVVPASDGKLEFKIVATGVGFPMSLFKPRVVRGVGGGVEVVLLGRRVLIKHAFMLNGQVWARGSYGASPIRGTSNRSGQRQRRKGALASRGGSVFEATGESFGRFAYGRNRFPITMLRSTSPPSALMNKEVVDAINDRIVEQAPSALKWAIGQALRG